MTSAALTEPFQRSLSRLHPPRGPAGPELVASAAADDTKNCPEGREAACWPSHGRVPLGAILEEALRRGHEPPRRQNVAPVLRGRRPVRKART